VKAVVFCGIQGSGKTTFHLERYASTHVRISLDLLRTRHREAVFLAACLETRQPFVVDNTNPTVADRSRYVGPALEAGFRVVALWFDSGPGEAIERNAARLGRQRIPVHSIVGTHRRLEVPTVAEGFHDVFRVRIGPDGGFVVDQMPP